MPLTREISKPIGEQTAETISWKHSLRDPDVPLTTRARSPSPNRGRGGMHSCVESGCLRKSGKRDKFRSSTGNLSSSFTLNGTSKSLSKSVELAGIEQEYIKNLQQQVYFLELEANYLREQSRKATEMHPVMTAEAERMLARLRNLQSETDGLRIELSRKEGHLGVQNTEKVRLVDRLNIQEESHSREKSLLMDEIVTLKKDKALLERDVATKSLHLSQADKDKSQYFSDSRSNDQKINLLRDQNDQSAQQLKLTQDALDEKRAELMRTENKLRDVEERYYSNTVTVQEKVSREFRDEIGELRRKLKEAEYAADQDRHLRSKLSEDSGMFVKENTLLTQQVHDFKGQLQRERELRDSADERRSADIGQLLTFKDQSKSLQLEISTLKDQLMYEQDRCKHYLDQLNKQEELGTSTTVTLASAQTRLNDLETMHRSTDTDNTQLRRDKMLLVDHVTDLQKQLESKDSDNMRLLARCQSLEKRFGDLERQALLETSLQYKKWGELENLAESMKNLSHHMSKSPVLDQ